ncbi:low-specificity L-threonine aldolase (plasmid) [Verrucomicrobiaceae bacterium 227]
MSIDLRSDTVTRPTNAMKEAMVKAEVGDDVFGDDPTVACLEKLAAKLLGKERALFVTSGTQSNLCALLAHCERGDEYIVGQTAHSYLFEGGGGAVFGSIQPQPLAQEENGTLDLEKVSALVKPDDFHYARTRLLCLENTTWGKVLPLDYLQKARRFVDEQGLQLHLDGARLFNAAIASGESAATLAAPFDSISICLSKGLGAPVGSVLVGGDDFIARARRWRKMLGGGLRQSGILAAAGIYALENQVDRLREDHDKATRLGEGLAAIPGVEVDPVQTNMLFVKVGNEKVAPLVRYLKERKILIVGYPGERIRLVTHLDIKDRDIEVVVESFAAGLAG